MKGIHPEFLLGLKGGLFEKIATELNTLPHRIQQEELHEMVKKAISQNPKNKELFKDEVDAFETSKNAKFKTSTFVKQEQGTSGIKIRLFSDFRDAYRKGISNTYRPSKEFFKKISSLRREIPILHIATPDRVTFIVTPEITLKGIKYNGAYINTDSESKGVIIGLTPSAVYTLQKSKIVMLISPSGWDSKGLQISRTLDLSETMRTEDKPDDQTGLRIFSEISYEEHEKVTSEENEFMAHIVSILNTCVYVNSQDPLIDELKPLKLYDSKQLAKMKSDVRENICTLPVKLVNWEFHTGREYSVGEVSVASHMRWQPCGPGRTQVKLIWVKDHVRNYNSVGGRHNAPVGANFTYDDIPSRRYV